MSAPEVVLYTTGWCPYCARARQLLADKKVRFREIDVEESPARRTEMIERSGRRTVPQVFVGTRHLGGCDDLLALEAAGELNALLAGNASD